MTELKLILTDQPTDSDEQVIATGLSEYNVLKAGYTDRRPLAALVRDPDTGATLGGMIGRTSYGLLSIDRVCLPEPMRGQDTGSKLLQMMEDEGVRRGCKYAVLHTLSHQAPGFYARRGWTEFGRIPCDPPGTARVFMTKTLQQ